MCGITGIVDKNNLDLATKMAELFFYRGPDDKGEYIDKQSNVALSMRRLSIIDLAAGHQPMSNEDDTIWVVCNGEIYNSPALRVYLEGRGHIFKTKNSDIEVLLHLYEEKGEKLVDDLMGMYAFVIFDKRKKRLLGVRDRVGIKPLYYSFRQGSFAFSSELKSLLLVPWITKELDYQSFYHYLSLQFVPAPETIFANIKKLPAGNLFIFDLETKNLLTKHYWQLSPREGKNKYSIDEWAVMIQKEMEGAVQRWSLSDVPVACSLSGGLDSATVLAMLTAGGTKKVKTYTLGFTGEDEKKYNELEIARKVSRHFCADHHEIVLNPKQVLEDLETMVWHLDEPYGGGLPSWYIYRLMGRDVKVAMTGTGGDELFSNYHKYQVYEQSWCHQIASSVKKALVTSNWQELKNACTYSAGHFYYRYLTDAQKEKTVVAAGLRGRFSTEAMLDATYKNAQDFGIRNAVACVDFSLQLPEEFLMVTDKFSMAHSIEARTPFLDHTLIEKIFSMPAHIRTGGLKHKGFMKRIVATILPEEIIDVPKKGFILPLTEWTRKELRPIIYQLLSPEFLKKQNLFNPDVYHSIVQPHCQGEADYTQQVWTMLMFQMWYQKFVSRV